MGTLSYSKRYPAPLNPFRNTLTRMQWAKPIRWGIFHHPTTPTYYNSLICLLGDVAHAGGPHQGAGAGQCLEDSLILSHVLGKLHALFLQSQTSSSSSSLLSAPSPRRTKAIEAAFRAYDEVRRPRAQEQVQTTDECGVIYNMLDPISGKEMSMESVLQNLNARFTWIWEHDLEADVKMVEARFLELVELEGEVAPESARL